ncbi:MAG: HTH domain-containing protein [Deltaproteobacteria bacterium]|nr:HTH domain-containing protein [Deltaproteobacteria bacterium]
MARGDQLSRQWKIIQTLISSKMGKSAAELEEDLDCHPRTVYRDLEALQVRYHPVLSKRFPYANYYKLKGEARIVVVYRHHIK